MKKCTECGEEMTPAEGTMPDGIPYTYYRCKNCRNEILNMTQLHALAEKYRVLKKYHVKLSSWGASLGLRIPKALAAKYRLTKESEIILIEEKDGLKIIPAH
ncbi:AbrB/MazE/SpoVT family DNA-binding domain-containing protein [Candidatus Woesearchaeota archaeon]|nr:MAG: AbrB/MazE/SpoVT family DNA-binding domain-containing protein [Candidatus Woesearchaeota archaeon]